MYDRIMDMRSPKPRGPITLLITGRRFRLWAAVAMLPGLYLGSYWLLLERTAYYVVVVQPSFHAPRGMPSSTLRVVGREVAERGTAAFRLTHSE